MTRAAILLSALLVLSSCGDESATYIRGDGPPFIRFGRSIRYRQRDLDLYCAKSGA